MKHLQPLVEGLEVEPVVLELDAHPELWNQYTLRTEGYAPVHNAVSDIWVRYRDWREWEELLKIYRRSPEPGEDTPERQAVAHFVGGEHESVWYPAIDALPSLRELLFELMYHYQVERLGGVLITRIPAGGKVGPHIDRGWHACYYEKIAVQLKSAPDQAFCFEDGRFECAPGTVYAFDNSFEHWVDNDSALERITLIVCVRRDQRLAPLHRGTGE